MELVSTLKYMLLELVVMDTKGLLTKNGSNKYFTGDNNSKDGSFSKFSFLSARFEHLPNHARIERAASVQGF